MRWVIYLLPWYRGTDNEWSVCCRKCGSGYHVDFIPVRRRMEVKKMPKSMKGVMHEWKTGTLHSGSKKGPVVKSRKQAIAIGLSEQRQQGKSVPPKPSKMRRKK